MLGYMASILSASPTPSTGGAAVPYRDRLFRKLSLGNKQRVGLAGAFQHQPRLIVLDEPTNALDPMGIVTLRTVVKERAAAGCGVVVSSHHLDEVAAIAHRIVVVNSGRIITELSPTTPQLENRFFWAIFQTINQTPTTGQLGDKLGEVFYVYVIFSSLTLIITVKVEALKVIKSATAWGVTGAMLAAF